MNLTEKLRKKYPNFELNQSMKSMSPIIIETAITTFEFTEGNGARTNQKIVALGEAKEFSKAKELSLKSALELLGVL